MIDSLSILIPCYNHDCTELVNTLAQQCRGIDGLSYEIVIVDDGSTDDVIVAGNMLLESIEQVVYKLCPKNKNRSCMRNSLPSFGKYEWQLHINANVHVEKSTFILSYLKAVVGDVKLVCGNTSAYYSLTNLRCRYERSFYSRNDIDYNNSHPYNHFRNTNYLCHRSVFDKVHYDETIQGYGYEDFLWGQDLKRNKIPMLYIDNPVMYDTDVDNLSYLKNIEESLMTLHLHAEKLADTSILRFIATLDTYNLVPIVKVLHRLLEPIEKILLNRFLPSYHLLNLYKLGHYLNIR